MNQVEVAGSVADDNAHVMSTDALEFVAALQREFGTRRLRLLETRADRRAALAAGGSLDFLAGTADVRAGDWRVADAPADLRDRRVEITGPAERKMLINALNCGARVFMADLEDALSPTWANVVGGQADLLRAVNRDLDFTSAEGKRYSLNAETGTLVINSTSEDLRLATMISDIHLAILPTSRIKKDDLDLTSELHKLLADPKNFTAFITGPSRTADIERVLAIGVHGPLELHILLLEDGQ